MISIIMPVLNEEKNIEDALKSASQLEGEYELIVVDGGSTDGTQKIAGKYAKVISARKGRARQMNAGARIAKGDILLFLHADCRLSQDSLIKIESALRDRKVVGGALKFHLDDDSSSFKAISYISNLRANISHVYPGDFGLFARRTAFEIIGGFSEIELMEDIDLCKKLSKNGDLVQPDAKIVSSSRRMKEQGVLRTWVHMQINRFLFFIGSSPMKLREFYKDIR